MPDGPAHLLSFVDPCASIWYGIPELLRGGPKMGEVFCVWVLLSSLLTPVVCLSVHGLIVLYYLWYEIRTAMHGSIQTIENTRYEYMRDK